MLELLWDIDTLRRLNEKGRALNTDRAALLDSMQLSEADQAKKNIPRKLSSIRERLLEVIQGVFRFKHVAASHIFVMMISSELRNKKSYAVPIQCLPYAGLKETNMRSMVRLVVKEMVKQGMKVAGKYVYIQRTFLPSVFYYCVFYCRLCNKW